MAQQHINYGVSPNDGTGDPLRDAFVKTESNFNELYAGGIQGSSGTSGFGSSGTSGNGSSGTSGNGSAGTSGSSGESYDVVDFNVLDFIDTNSGLTGTTQNKIVIRVDDTKLGFDGTGKLTIIGGGNGSSGTSGTSGVSGSSGISGDSGTSGTSGISGTSGTSGNSGTSGTSGTSGVTGSSGTSASGGDIYETLGFSSNNGTNVISTGLKGYKKVDYNGQIIDWTVVATTQGSTEINVLKSTYGGFGTFSSIVGTEYPSLSSSIKNSGSTLTNWTTGITSGDILEYYVNSATTITDVYFYMKVKRL